jgi:hypothetical protein
VKASYIQRREIEVELLSREVVARPDGATVTLSAHRAKALMYALRDALKDAGEEV